MKEQKVPKYMLDHFAEDKKAFARYDELLTISGEHMSHIRKDLTEVKDILVKNAEDTKEYRKTVDAHMARVEPVIKAYEDSLIIKIHNDYIGKKIINYGAIGAAALIVGGIIMSIIRKFI